MASGSIIDQIWQGVIDPASNVALGYLAQILGTSLVPAGAAGSAPVVSLVTQLSVTLHPVFWALLIIIVGYIGISGVYRTASDGTFLGRQWSSFMVPGMVIACVILMSPIPSKNGVTIGQYVFVRGLIFGSNFADFALKKAFEVNATAAAAEYNHSAEFVKQINQQAKLALGQYVCGMQLTQMGYGARPDYFILLNKVCKIEWDTYEPFIDYYIPAKPGYATNQSKAIQQINSAYGTDIPITDVDKGFGVNTIRQNGSEGKRTVGGKEVMCYYKAFKDTLNAPLQSEIATALKAAPLPGVEPISGLSAGESMPTIINSRQLNLRDTHIGGSWAPVLDQAYPCVVQALGSAAQEKYQEAAGNQVPWRKGWVYAGQAIEDDLNSYSNAMKKSKLVLNPGINAPEPSLLNDTLQDRSNSVLLKNVLDDLQTILHSENSKIDKVADDVAAKKLMAPEDARSMTAARIAANAYLGYGSMVAAYGGVGSRPNPGQLKGIASFMDTFVGKAGSATGAAGGAVANAFKTPGNMTKSVTRFVKKLNIIAAAAEKGKGILGSVGGIPGVGSLIKLGVGVVSAVLLPSEREMALLTMAVTVMNVIVLLPQVIMMVVLLLWLAKSAVWFMIIPLATVIIALPNTRAGHDMWKSALAIVLTPLLATLFYIISLFITDVMYDVVFTWVFAPMVNGDNSAMGWAKSAGSLLLQLATGELLFRVLAALGLFVAITLFMSMLIVRGPDLVARSLGLGGSSGDLGDDLERARGRLLDNHIKLGKDHMM